MVASTLAHVASHATQLRETPTASFSLQRVELLCSRIGIMLHVPKRRWVCLLAVIGLAAIPCILWLTRKDRVTEENYQKIREGMTLQEVIAILGPEASDSLLDPPI